ncbi:MAG: threonylcarbamoyl-AMP synthase [bacterium]|nr:threonylcarbamoyl-AMP synthase [bacterium]
MALLEINPDLPEDWLVARAANTLRRGGVAVIPTDTVYGMACCISQQDAIRKIYELKKMDRKKPLAILVGDIRSAGQYAKGLSTPVFRMMKRVLPGPYTFIFEASGEVPKIMLRKRRTIGIRVPDNPIALALLAMVDEPLLTTSIRNPEDAFVNDPVEIDKVYGHRVDMVVDGGHLLDVPSTVVDFSSGNAELLREGKGDVEALEIFD